MKKIALIALLASTVSMSANAGLWNAVKGMSGEDVPSVQLSIDAAGHDLRGYVYDVPQMASVCISVYASESVGNSSPMQCKTYDEVLKAVKAKEELSKMDFFDIFYKK